MACRYLLTAAIISFAFSAGAQSGERILSFHSQITVDPDGSMTVRETIRVNVLGEQISRGIYRDFPTRYKDARGNRVVVGFEILEVHRDGAPEAYHTEKLSNGVRVYFGRRNYLLPYGEHVYQFIYRTTHQLGFFDEHDELYWNVTGNDWGFPIDVAAAVVRLPDGVVETDMTAEGYTGLQDARGRDYSVEVTGPGEVRFDSTRPLSPREGMTIVVGFPKGFVEEPTLADTAGLVIRNHAGDVTVFGGLAIVVLFYGLTWLRVGVDPPKGGIVPRDTPPEGLSPAALRYVRKMGVDAKTFSVALISMAIKGYLHIEEQGEKKYFVVRGDAGDDVLTEEERAVAGKLFAEYDRVELDDSNHKAIGGARSELVRVLKDQFKGVYFHRNTGYVFIGMLLSVVAIVGGTIASAGSISIVIGVGFVLLLATNIVFARLLRAPTREGRRVMDDAEAFQMYLRGDGPSRYSLKTDSEELGRRFEQYLPFAIALDRESEWADGFTDALSATSRSKSEPDYFPIWYYGANWNTVGARGFTDSLGSTFTSVVASSVTAPGSSSGSGGGGFSGGGGGGGGGGGW